MKSVEIFLNFPIMDINMNILKHDRSKVEREQIERMNSFWGDESWNSIGYEKSKQLSLLGERADQKTTNETLEAGFRKRLKEVAGFASVPKPMPMRNKNNAVVYYLYWIFRVCCAKNQPDFGSFINEVMTLSIKYS
jgi:three-Cys-motif partner protein